MYCALEAVASSGVICTMLKADSVKGEMLDRIEVRSGHIMSDICMQTYACNGYKLPCTRIQ